ncbi:acetamidase/formamidase family protein [Halanaerobium hydrogeniformans]|uniref:Acetamidase/Formamidase n=1 Tax=Halanaerobium hydrogeniformans TaxID=656519 RepID=E4RNB7_HALHG|nr:acetamidase/formamidase family protein [Halanaerobium hydrogeniformans]ADQ13585.1 Acetamidase/Formamidase [Halanaerobium hydrogeniformans]
MKKLVYCDETTDIVGPGIEMVDTLSPGGKFIVRTNPGCWGNMITPSIKSWHEVGRPVAIEDAEVGDAVAIKIDKINVLSRATSSGTDAAQGEYFKSDPGIDSFCPNCGTKNPDTYIKGTGEEAIKCQNCDSPVVPFTMPHGYTMYFDNKREFGITVDENISQEIAEKANEYSNLTSAGMQHSINVFAKHDMPGVPARVIPMIGNIGTVPAMDMPSSHNAGDFAQFLLGAEHEYACSEKDLNNRSDAHMDVNEVREGAVIIAPVKVKGAGVYVGDVHAMQGDGEIAGHTTDIAAEVEITIDLIKNLNNLGPIILPNLEDLTPLTKPYTEEENKRINETAQSIGLSYVEREMYPIQMIGSGADLNSAAADGLKKLAKLLDYPLDEVKNRVTVNGDICIGRAPGIVNITILTPISKLKEINLAEIVKNHYTEK